MAVFKLSSKQKLIATIGISLAFFIAEISVAFYTGSLALLADAFHYLNDLISFVVALAAILITEHAKSRQGFSFGWARAQLLGAFFNGVFLLALGVSIFLQSIERFISIQHVDNPFLVLIMGCVGLTLNIISATILHEHHGHDHAHHGDGKNPSSHSEEFGHGHSHNDDVNIESAMPTSNSASSSRIDTSAAMTPIGAHTDHLHSNTKLQAPGRDLGMMGVLTHVIGDALNNIGVIIAALVIWLTSYDARFYADPGVSMGIALMILLSSLPLVKNSGKILMQSAPKGVDLDHVRHDLEKIPGVESIHELHIWRLDQKKAIASAHIVVSNNDVVDFMERARTISECLHAYGIHSATLQPELSTPPGTVAPASTTAAETEPEPETEASSTVGVSSTDPSNASIRRRHIEAGAAAETAATATPSSGRSCQIACNSVSCETLTCCSTRGLRI
ncbi:hypothetical protein SLS62_007193 [Diatrype stigma]|uniref:Uncharacterized protein n=1 Tax=Diatrype stigma TaxID=117547 RepID=A0AAN9UX15_9PEZI